MKETLTKFAGGFGGTHGSLVLGNSKLTKELAQKLDGWKSCGFLPSDSVRLALSLLPSSPDEIRNGSGPTLHRLGSLRSQGLQVELKDEKEALSSLQEW